LPDFLDPQARDVVLVTGPDAATYLQSQVSQELRPMQVGDWRWSLVLEPTGKVTALIRVTRTGEEEFELETDAGFGEGLIARLRKFMIRVDAQIEFRAAADGEPRAEFERRRVDAGWPRMGAEIRAGETIPAATGVVPVAVDFAKGCYPGQELVERMDSRGADAPVRLRIVDVVDGTAVGAPVLDADGAEAGVITSIVENTALAAIRRGFDVGRAPTDDA
jgi:folate-binding protein YgfZ